jgi:hypothetical protein
LAKGSKGAIWLKQLLYKLNISTKQPIKMLYVATGMLSKWSKKPMFKG